MQIVEVPVILDSRDFAHEKHSRTPGVHLSNVIRSLVESEYSILKGEGMDPQALEGYRTAGFLFEYGLYEVILRDQEVERLGEFVVDDIIMTPDAVNLTRGRGIESKCTFRSMNHDVTDMDGEFMEWWLQMMGYAKGLSIYLWDLYVMFMCGDYRQNRRPTPRHWEIELTREEVERNWRRIVNHRDWMKQTGRI